MFIQRFILKDVDPKKGKTLGVVMACVAITVVPLGCKVFLQAKIASAGVSAISGGRVALLRSRWCGVGNHDGAVGGCESLMSDL